MGKEEKSNFSAHQVSPTPAPTILRPGFESQAHHLRFFQFVLKLYQEKNVNKQKEAGIGPF